VTARLSRWGNPLWSGMNLDDFVSETLLAILGAATTHAATETK